MNWWIALLIGLIIGWLIELLIDYFYWRPKRVCTDAERSLEVSLSRAQTENRNLTTQLEDFRIKGQRLTEVEAGLQDREAELFQLAASYEERETALNQLADTLQTKEAELTELSANYDKRIGRLAEMEADRQARTADLDSLSLDYEAQEQRLAALAVTLERRETELGGRSAANDSKESQLTEWAARLRVREAELHQLGQRYEHKARELADLEAQLKMSETKFEDRTAELANAQAVITSLHKKISELEAKLADRKGSQENGDKTDLMAGVTTAAGVGIAAVVDGARRRVKAPQLDRFASDLTAGKVPVSGTGTPASTVEVLFDGHSKGTTLVTDKGRWLMEVNVSQEGHYNVQARAVDVSGKVLATAPQRQVYLQQSQTPTETRVTAGSGSDDLQKVWGIGPHIDKLLRANGINTFAELAATPVSRLDEILAKAGRRFRMSKQETWAAQARLADAGRWEELKVMQNGLDWKGRRRLHR